MTVYYAENIYINELEFLFFISMKKYTFYIEK